MQRNREKIAARVNRGTHRVGSTFPTEAKIAVFTYGLNPVIETLVTRFRETIPRRKRTFTRIAQSTRDEGDAERTRDRTNRATAPSRRGLQPFLCFSVVR